MNNETNPEIPPRDDEPLFVIVCFTIFLCVCVGSCAYVTV
jgi:hypothetical protein